MSESLYRRGIYGYVTVDFISFQDPYTKDSQPLFWANGITLQYSSFNSIYSLVNATLSTSLRNPQQGSRSHSNGFKYNDGRAVVSIPFLSQPNLPSQNFKSFFHLARLGNLFYDVALKKGIIFIVADSLQAGAMGVVSVGSDVESSHDQMFKCLEFLKKQHNSKKTTFITTGSKASENSLWSDFGVKSDKIEFGAIMGGIKSELKSLNSGKAKHFSGDNPIYSYYNKKN